MQHFVNIGELVQLNWTLHSIAGNEFSLRGHSYKLRFSTGNQSAVATGVTHSGNVLTWTFTPTSQWKLGSYMLWLEIYSFGRRIITITYPDAFHLISGDCCLDTSSTANQTQSTTLNIVSTFDANKFSPVIPVIDEEHGYWLIDGEPVLDENGNKVYAEHSLEYDPETNYIIIDRGRVDANGKSMEQVITSYAEILAELESRYTKVLFPAFHVEDNMHLYVSGKKETTVDVFDIDEQTGHLSINTD